MADFDDNDDTDQQTVDSGDQGGGTSQPAIPPAPSSGGGDTSSDDQAPSAPPASEEAPAPTYYQLNNDDIADAVRASDKAHDYRKQKWGVDPNTPPAMFTPDMPQRIQAYLSGADAYHPDDATKAEDTVDPTHQVSDYGRMMKTMSQLEDQHGTEGTSAYLAHKRQMFDAHAAAANHAADAKGSVWDWVNSMKEALSNIPSPIEWGADVAQGSDRSPTAKAPPGKQPVPDLKADLEDAGEPEAPAANDDLENAGPNPFVPATGSASPGAIPEKPLSGEALSQFMEDRAASRGGKGTIQDTLADRAEAQSPPWAYLTGKDPVTGQEIARIAIAGPAQGAEFAQHGFDKTYDASKDPAAMEQAVNATPDHLAQRKAQDGDPTAELTSHEKKLYAEIKSGQGWNAMPPPAKYNGKPTGAVQPLYTYYQGNQGVMQGGQGTRGPSLPEHYAPNEQDRVWGVIRQEQEQERAQGIQPPPGAHMVNQPGAPAADQPPTPYRGSYNRGEAGVPPEQGDNSIEADAARLYPNASQAQYRAKYVADRMAAQSKGAQQLAVASQRAEGTLGAAGIRQQTALQTTGMRTGSAEKIAAQKAAALDAFRQLQQGNINWRNQGDIAGKVADSLAQQFDLNTPEGRQQHQQAVKDTMSMIKDLRGSPQGQPAPATPQSPGPTAPPAPAKPGPTAPAAPLQIMNYPDGSQWAQRMNPATGKPGWVKVK